MTLPNISLLVEAANDIARSLGRPRPEDAVVQAKLHRVFVEKKTMEVLAAGIITNDEAVRLVLTHLTDATDPLADVGDPAIIDKVRRALLG